MNRRIRVGIVDDHPLMREGIVFTFEEAGDFIEVAGNCGTSEEALAMAQDAHLDIMLLDISIPGGGLETAAQIAAQHPQVKLVILTVSERPAHVTTALTLGAKGYILKGIGGQELVRAIKLIDQGQIYVSPELAGKILAPASAETPKAQHGQDAQHELTAREFSVVNLLAEGKTNKQIADKLDLSEKTIKYYLTSIFQKLGVRNRLEAAVMIRGKKL